MEGVVGAVTESPHPDPQTGQRSLTQNRTRPLIQRRPLETYFLSKPTSPKTTATNWGSSVQTHEPMGVISTQTTSAISVLDPHSSLSVHRDIFSSHLTELLGVGVYVTSVASCGT